MKTAITPKIIPYLAVAPLLMVMTYNANTEAVFEHESAISNVQHVVIETPGELEIRPGKKGRLAVEADPDVLQQLENMSQKDTLYLRSKGSFGTQQKIRYILVIPKLQSLSLRGDASATVGPFRGDTLDIELGGNGHAAVEDITFDRLTLRVSGTGSIDVGGRSERLLAQISGSGRIRAENHETQHAEVVIAGTGDANVNADKHLTAVISGAGNVRYKGYPEVSRSISGAGSIKPLRSLSKNMP